MPIRPGSMASSMGCVPDNFPFSMTHLAKYLLSKTNLRPQEGREAPA